MARNRFVAPDTVRLDLSDGDFLIVRKELNAGEHRDMWVRVMKPVTLPTDGRLPDLPARPQVDAFRAPVAEVLAYLVEWSLVDEHGTVVSLRGKDTAFIEAALNNIDLDSFAEIVAAVQAYDRACTAAREGRKANPTGAPALSLT